MTRPGKRGAAAALVAVVLGLGCGGPGAPTAVPTPSPLTTPSPSAAISVASSSPASSPQPLRMGPLPAGRYRTNSFVPQLVFTLPDGWSEFFADEEDEIFMGSAEAELAISRASEVRDPVGGAVVQAPEDLAGWITLHPAFDAPDPVAIQVAGIDSLYVDLPGPTADTRLFHFPGGDFHIPPGVATRVYVVPLAGSDISIVVLPAEGGGTIEAAIERTHPIVESLEIVP